ncbi:MAG: PHB depolymerase family esterase, partial [Rhizonema sp. PD38]|nr:PHB depolymerase family esterase [Rhizonema sp. PD38]
QYNNLSFSSEITVNSYLNLALFRYIIVCLFSITVITSCKFIDAKETTMPGDNSSSSDSDGQLNDQGIKRTYYLYTPESYDPDRPMPLVIVFHGHGGSGHSIAQVSRFNDLANQKGFIVVYPDGLDGEWSLRGIFPAKVNDVSFTTALLEHIQHIRNIDSRRIYATGFSKGAILTQALACKLPDRIAAFASVAGSLSIRFKPSCHPSTTVSMLMINGTNDQSVHYQGDHDSQRGSLISIPETVNFWRQHDGCASQPQVRKLPDPNPKDRFFVNVSRYSGCSKGTEVILASVMGGGHFWPGGASSDASLKKFNQNLGFNASKTIWDFFQRHSLPSE